MYGHHTRYPPTWDNYSEDINMYTPHTRHCPIVLYIQQAETEQQRSAAASADKRSAAAAEDGAVIRAQLQELRLSAAAASAAVTASVTAAAGGVDAGAVQAVTSGGVPPNGLLESRNGSSGASAEDQVRCALMDRELFKGFNVQYNFSGVSNLELY